MPRHIKADAAKASALPTTLPITTPIGGGGPLLLPSAAPAANPAGPAVAAAGLLVLSSAAEGALQEGLPLALPLPLPSDVALPCQLLPLGVAEGAAFAVTSAELEPLIAALGLAFGLSEAYGELLSRSEAVVLGVVLRDALLLLLNAAL